MPTPRPETDLSRAQQLKRHRKNVSSQSAKDKLTKAIEQLENRAATNAAKLGRRRRRPTQVIG